MKLVGVSGVQGAGKTTLLEALKQQGVRVDDFKVSRAVQKKLGAEALTGLTSDAASMMRFQEAVLQEKAAHEADVHLLDTRGCLTERTMLDVAAYATLWSRKLDADPAWLVDFIDRCSWWQKQLYEKVLLLPLMPHVIFEEDPARASRADAEALWEIMLDLLPIFRQGKIDNRAHIIVGKTVDERVQETINFIETA